MTPVLEFIKNSTQPLNIAHRGGMALYPENTLTGFHASVDKYKVDMLEMDLQLTRDEKVIVLHDDSLDRTTNGKGEVAKKSYKDINNPNSPPGKFQIEADGSLIAVETNSWRVLTGLSGIRYATQADFDKMCFENPDPRYPYDWNAEVYKLFIEHQESLPVPTGGGLI